MHDSLECREWFRYIECNYPDCQMKYGDDSYNFVMLFQAAYANGIGYGTLDYMQSFQGFACAIQVNDKPRDPDTASANLVFVLIRLYMHRIYGALYPEACEDLGDLLDNATTYDLLVRISHHVCPAYKFPTQDECTNVDVLAHALTTLKYIQCGTDFKLIQAGVKTSLRISVRL